MTGPTDGPPADAAGGRSSLPPELDPRGPRRASTPGPADTPRTRGTRRGPRRSKKKILGWIAGALAAILVIGAATGWAAFDHIVSGIKKLDVFAGLTDRPSGGVVGDLNILVVGSDSRSGLTSAQKKQMHVGHDVGQRSDTMILLHIPRGGGKAVLVSLPRDSYVTIPRHKDATGHWVPAQKNKLNAAYSYGGAKLTVATIEKNTGVRIDHYIEVNFLGFVKIVDALGGVTVCTPTPIHDPVHRLPTGGYGGSGLELPAGKSELNGLRALEYVRAREFDPTADLGRIQRQQKFMSAMVQKAKSTGVLLNPDRLYHVVQAVADSLTTDKDFGPKQIKDLIFNLRSMSPAHIEMLTVPLKPGNFMTNVGDVVEWDPVLSKQLFHDLTEDKPVGPSASGKRKKVTIPPSSIYVQVLNSTQTNGLAAKVTGDLSRVGFHASVAGNSPAGSDASTTVIRYGPTRADSAKTLAASIPGSKLQLDNSFGNGLQVLVGSNYTGVQPVKVIAQGQNGTLANPRTAAQNICS
jgi:LCP family protein required for cell wall assembly